MSPSQKSHKLLREFGYTSYGVEAYNHPATAKFQGGWAKKKDLLGLGDILALKPGETLMVNATDHSSISGHITKYMENPRTVQSLTDWLGAGNPFVLHGWRPDRDADDGCIVKEAYLLDGEVCWD